MSSIFISSQETWFPNSSPISGKAFCCMLGVNINLSSVYHLQSNGQTERLNQELGIGSHCLVSQYLTSGSKHLIWVEHAHNTLSCPFSGVQIFLSF